jgi:hypothetical protein
MRIVGKWLVCDDGVGRPAVAVKVARADGTFSGDDFLVDTCADRPVLSAALLANLNCPTQVSPPGLALQGIGGDSAFVMVDTALELTRDDGGPVCVRGQFAAFTDPAATDLSILGRDVLDIFDVLVSRRRDEVLLLAGNHRYRVEDP